MIARTVLACALLLAALSLGCDNPSPPAETGKAGHGDAGPEELPPPGVAVAWDTAGSLSNDNHAAYYPQLGLIEGANDVVDVSAGAMNWYLLTRDGKVWASGHGGRNGDDTTENRPQPVRVVGLNDVTAISAGTGHCLALRRDGTVWGWGSNHDGQLGDGTSRNNPLTPVQTKVVKDIVAIAAGHDFSAALDRQGRVWVWGMAMTGAALHEPRTLDGISDAVAISGGLSELLALKKDGTVWRSFSSTPDTRMEQLSGLDHVKAIAAGRYFSLAMKNDGTLWAWGDLQLAWHGLDPETIVGPLRHATLTAESPDYGIREDEAGDEDTRRSWHELRQIRADQSIVYRVLDWDDVVGIAAASRATVLRRDGSVWEWGWDCPLRKVEGIPPARKVASGWNLSVALVDAEVPEAAPGAQDKEYRDTVWGRVVRQADEQLAVFWGRGVWRFPQDLQPRLEPFLGHFVKVAVTRSYRGWPRVLVLTGGWDRIPPIVSIEKITSLADSPAGLPVTITVEPSRKEYRTGEPIRLTVRVRNTAEQPTSLHLYSGGASLCKDYRQVWGLAPENLYNQEHPYGLANLSRLQSLGPGQELVFSFSSTRMVPSGIYQLVFATSAGPQNPEMDAQSEIGTLTVLAPADAAERVAALKFWLHNADLSDRARMAEALLLEGDASGVEEILRLLETGVYKQQGSFSNFGGACALAWQHGEKRGQAVMLKLIDEQTRQDAVNRMVPPTPVTTDLVDALDSLLADQHPTHRDISGWVDEPRVCDIFADWLAGYTEGQIKFPVGGSIQERDQAVNEVKTRLRREPALFQIAAPVSGEGDRSGLVKPGDLRLSGTKVFEAPERTHEILKNVFLVVKFLDPDDLGIVETTFAAGQQVVWVPLRSSYQPVHQFRGNWTLDENGELSIRGRYEPIRGATELPPRLRKLKNTHYVVSEVLLRQHSHTLDMHVKRAVSEAEVAAAAARGEPVWGKAAEGVQARLRVKKHVWKAGETPTLLADIRNQGTHEFRVWRPEHLARLEVDGTWYFSTVKVKAAASDLPPGTQLDGIAFTLSDSWQAYYTGGAAVFLKLSPGKHLVRVALWAGAVQTGEIEILESVHARSNLVEIEILPPGAKPAAAAPAAEEVRAAIAELASEKPAEVIAAAEIIVRTNDRAAWEALRAALADPEKLGRLEVVTEKPGQEGLPYDLMYGHLAKILRTVAQGNPKQAAATLQWLVEQKPYAQTYRTGTGNDRDWRAWLAYDAFQYLRSPPPGLEAFYRETLESKSVHDDLKRLIAEALAAHGTSWSVALFEKHLWKWAQPEMLIRHRSNYECVRLLLSVYRGATNAKYAHRMLGMLWQDSMPRPSRFWPPYALPAISPRGEEARKFAAMLKGFLADHGQIALTEEEAARIKGLVESIEKGISAPPDDGPQGTGKTIQELIADLDSKDVAVRLDALRALAVRGDQAVPAIPALVRMLGDPGEMRVRDNTRLGYHVERVGQLAGAVLRNLGAPAVPPLLRVVGADPGAEAGANAAMALGDMLLGSSYRPSGRRWRDLYTPPSYKVTASYHREMERCRFQVWLATLRNSELRASAREPEDTAESGAIATLVAGLDQHFAFIAPYYTPETLKAGGDDTAPLLAAIRDFVRRRGSTIGDAVLENASRAAVRLFGILKGAEGIPTLLGLLAECGQAGEVLAALGAPAVEPLIRTIADPDSPIREAAGWALFRIRDPKAVPLLLHALKHPDALVRKWVAETLGAMAEPQAIESLVEALRDSDPEVRGAAAGALGHIPSAKAAAFQPLAELLQKDSVWTVRVQAAWALGRLAPADERTRELLTKAAKDDPDPRVRKATTEVIEKMLGREEPGKAQPPTPDAGMETPPGDGPLSTGEGLSQRPGELAGPKNEFTEETSRRAKSLLADLDGFTAILQYFPPRGADRGEYPSLTLRTWNIRDERLPNWPAIMIRKEQAKALVEHLAVGGWLARAECVASPVRGQAPRAPPTGPVYVLSIAAGGWQFEERLSFNAQTYWRLLEIRGFLPGEPAETIDKHMLAALAEKHPAWKDAGEVALGMLKELNLSLTYTGPEERRLRPFFDLWLYTGVAPPSLPPAGQVWVRPNTTEVRGIVDALAATGVLESLKLAPEDLKPARGYSLTIAVGQQVYHRFLGWDANMRSVLETIVDRLPADGRAVEVLQELLERLEPFRAEWDNAAGLKAVPIDWDKADDYSFGPWKYVYRFDINGEGKVIGHWGQMLYRNKVVEGINLNDSLPTPWGPMYWVGVRQTPAGPHGWMRQRDAEGPDGQKLPSPLDAVRYHEVAAHSSKLLVLIMCRKEQMWVNLFGPDVEGKSEPRQNPLVLVGSLSAQQVKAVLAEATYAGLLSKAQPKWANYFLTRGREDYLLQFSWPTVAIEHQVYSVDLGTWPQAIERLASLKSALDGKPAEAVEQVVNRLEEAP